MQAEIIMADDVSLGSAALLHIGRAPYWFWLPNLILNSRRVHTRKKKWFENLKIGSQLEPK